VKSINFCKLLDDHLRESKDAIKIDGGKVDQSKDDKLTAKSTANDIHKYNHQLINSSPQAKLPRPKAHRA